MKSPIAFLVSVLGCMVLAGTIHAANEADWQLPSESFPYQDKQQQTGTSPSWMTEQESINSDSTGDSTNTQDSAQQIEAKELEVELRKLLLLSCPR